MTQIDFYLLPTHDSNKQLLYTCRIVEKAFRQGLTAFVYTNQPAIIKELDDALWQTRPDSFLAHEICDEKPIDAPIQLSTKNFDKVTQDICINLSTTVFEDFGYYQRVIEIINNEKTALSRARDHFRFYQQQHIKPNTIDLRK